MAEFFLRTASTSHWRNGHVPRAHFTQQLQHDWPGVVLAPAQSPADPWELRLTLSTAMGNVTARRFYLVFGSTSAPPLAVGGEVRYSAIQCDIWSFLWYNTNK